MGCPDSTDNSMVPHLHLRLRDHHERVSRKKARMSDVETVSSIYEKEAVPTKYQQYGHLTRPVHDNTS